MQVAVIGAGIVGVTTAYELGADGHRVTVFERRGSVAAEASFANAGVVSAGCVTPWAAPGMPGQVLRQMMSPHAPLRLRPTLNPAALAWAWKWFLACRARTYQANRLRMQRLAAFSRERLHTLTRTLKLDYERADGYLLLMRTPKDLAAAQPGLAALAGLRTRFATLDAGQCRTVEPGLSAETELHAGIYLPDDEVGNCRQFALLMRREAQKLGVRFRFHTSVRRIVAGPGPLVEHLYTPPDKSMLVHGRAVPADPGMAPTEPMHFGPMTQSFDAVIVCAAVSSNLLLRPLGLRLPLQAVHGYSLTAPLRQDEAQPELGPRAAVMDERYRIAISRLGARVRVAGGAEFGGSMESHDDAAFATLYKVLHDWFPGTARLSHVQQWKGARPMLPDGPPVLGASGFNGIWLNLGHGADGWALACGSARLLADAVAGRPVAIDTEGLGIERLAH